MLGERREKSWGVDPVEGRSIAGDERPLLVPLDRGQEESSVLGDIDAEFGMDPFGRGFAYRCPEDREIEDLVEMNRWRHLFDFLACANPV